MSITKALRRVAGATRSELRMGVSKLRLGIAPPQARQLEIGSGPVHKPGWVTVDMCSGADYYWDLTRPLPFSDDSFDLAYCSHVLEHFWYPDLKRLLHELKRVLVPGGQLLICVPDASLYIDSYLGKRDAAPLLQYKPAVYSGQRMDFLNYIAYMDTHHRFMFDRDNLAHHCREAGFADCRDRAFDPALDLAERDYEGLYMACTKGNP